MPDGHAQNRNPLTALQMARADLIAFQCGADPNYRPSIHHRIIGAALMEQEAGNLDRLRIETPPRHGKTRQCGVDYVGWALGRNPHWNSLYATYNKDRAADVGFQVRELIGTSFHQRCFPASRIDPRSRSNTKFDLRRITHAGGEERVVGGYRAIGLGGSATGRGFDLIVLDDTAKDRQQADSPAYKKLLENRFSSSIYTRSEGHGAITSIMCMVGDTRVLMADGSLRQLRQLSPGDAIATYENGGLAATVVERWSSQGVDDIFEIRTSRGSTKANARHPFLVDRHGERQWIRVSQLRTGDLMLGLDAARMLVPEKSVLRKAAIKQLKLNTGVTGVIRDGENLSGRRLHRPLIQPFGEQLESSTDMASPRRNISTCSKLKEACVQFASNLLERMLGRTGAESFALTTTTPRAAFEDSCAMTATLRSDMERRQKTSFWPLNTSGFTAESIVSVIPCGRDEVFDIQVARTENFIADGFVSHNTRWGENDLHGHIEREYGQDGWITIRLPAEGGPGDFLNRPLGEALWPDRWPKEKLQRIKNSIFARDWMALYQQEPTSIDGLKFSKRWFQWYDIAPVTKMNLYMTADYAVTEDQERDFTEMYIWGIDHRGHIWLLDGYYGQVSPDKWATEEMALLKSHRPRLLFEETGVIRNATTSLLATLRRDNGRYVTRIALPAVADKVANVTSFQALAAMGMIHMPRSHPKQIGTRLVEQLLAFPTGEHDDGVDNCGLIGRGRDMMMRAQIGSGKTSGGIRPFTAEWLHFEEKDDDGLRDC